MIHTEKIQLARIRLIAERRIGEIDVAVFAHHDIVGRIEALAVPLLGQHLHFALLVHAYHTARPALAGIKAPLRIETIAVGAVRIFAKHGGLLARYVFHDLVVGHIAEQKKTLARPRRAFSEPETGGHAVDQHVRRLLRGSGPPKHTEYRDTKLAAIDAHHALLRGELDFVDDFLDAVYFFGEPLRLLLQLSVTLASM